MWVASPTQPTDSVKYFKSQLGNVCNEKPFHLLSLGCSRPGLFGTCPDGPDAGLPQPRCPPLERCQSSAWLGDSGTTTHLAQKELATIFPNRSLLAGEGRDGRPVASHPRSNGNPDSACTTAQNLSTASVCPQVKSLITIYHISCIH